MGVYIGEIYKEVEYIQSSGTQYIDTGYTPNKNVKVQLDFAYTNTSTRQQRLFGVHSSSTSSFTFDIYINGSGLYGWSATNGDSGGGGYINTGVTVDTNRHTVIHSNTQTQILTNGTSIYNNTRTGYITTNNDALGPIPLFAGYNFTQNPNGYSLFASAKIYSCKIWNGTTLVRDMIPCYRVNDNEIGLFDKVNNKFYANSGTGTFTKGNDVKVFQAELKNAYIGEVWTPGSNTIAYFPFTNNQNDTTGTYSLNKTLTKDTIGYSFTQSGGNIDISGGLQKNPKFVGIWVYVKPETTTTSIVGLLGCNRLGGITFWISHRTASYNRKIHTYTGSNWSIQTTTDWNIFDKKRHYYAYSLVGTTFYLCRDGVVTTLLSQTPYDYGLDMPLCNFGSSTSCNIGVSDWIIEDTGWTSEQMQLYYNQTKSNYGL